MDPLSFIGGTLLGIGATHAVGRLQKSHRPNEGLGDLLGWAFLIDEGIILMKDGSFLAGLVVEPTDMEYAPTVEVNRAAQVVHEALAMLGEGYGLEVNVHREEVNSYLLSSKHHFPTPALTAMEAERRSQFTRHGVHYATRCALLITYTPPREYWARWEHLVVRGGGGPLDYGHILSRFKREWAEITALLGSVFTVRPLDSQALITECHAALTGHNEPVHTGDDVPHSYVSHALASCDFETGFYPVLGGAHLFVCTITSLGTHTRCLAGHFFNSMREEVRWHMRFVTLSRHAAERRIRRLQTRWFHQRGGLRTLLGAEENAIEDQDAVAMQEATGSALAATMSGRARFGYFTNTFLLRDESLQRGRTRAQALLQTLRDQGFACSLETVNATDAFIGSLPGHGFANLRRPLISSRNVAHLFPTSAPWTGPSRCPNPFFKPGSPALVCVRTLGSTPFYLNLYQEDVGHTLVVGATGAGKSVLAGFLALNFLRYAHSRVHVFDLGRSHLVPCLAAGGVHFDFGSNAVSALQPLRHIDHETERMWALSWLESIYDLSDAMPDARGRRELSRVLDLLRHTPIDHRTLTALHLTLPLRLQNVLERYTVKGPYGRLLDGEKEETSDARMQVYELGPVLELGPGVMVPLLTALFRRIERSLDGSPTLIIIEEAWAALLQSRFAERIQGWLLTLRKHNASVVIVAHSPAQICALPNAALITESCPTRIVLPNPEARIPEVAEVYKGLNLNEREIAVIASARRKRDYYYKGPSGSRLFELVPGPVAQRLLMPMPGMTARDYPNHVRMVMERYGEHFIDHLGLATG